MNIQSLINDNVDGSTFISLDTLTVVDLRGGRANPHLGRVTKRVTGSNVMIFTNKKSNGYANMVERRLIQEGKDPASFQLQPLKWGTRIEGTPFIEHEEALYLQVIFLRAGTTQYFLDGNPIEKDQILGLPVRQEAEQGGLDNKVIVRTYSVLSIETIRINKMEYKLR